MEFLKGADREHSAARWLGGRDHLQLCDQPVRGQTARSWPRHSGCSSRAGDSRYRTWSSGVRCRSPSAAAWSSGSAASRAHWKNQEFLGLLREAGSTRPRSNRPGSIGVRGRPDLPGRCRARGRPNPRPDRRPVMAAFVRAMKAGVARRCRPGSGSRMSKARASNSGRQLRSRSIFGRDFDLRRSSVLTFVASDPAVATTTTSRPSGLRPRPPSDLPMINVLGLPHRQLRLHRSRWRKPCSALRRRAVSAESAGSPAGGAGQSYAVRTLEEMGLSWRRSSAAPGGRPGARRGIS